MVQQKQRKQVILTDGKNIICYCFQQIQCLKRNFKIAGIWNFTYTKHYAGNAKLLIFSFMPQWQRIKPDFMNHKYQATNQTNNPNS